VTEVCLLRNPLKITALTKQKGPSCFSSALLDFLNRWLPTAANGTIITWRSTLKTPVFCAVERGGQLRRRVVADVTAATLRQAINEDVDSRARLMTDEYSAYRWLKKGWTGTHETVCHRTFQYARADVHVNTAESSHALIRRGLIGIYHNVSREYLHRYLWQFDFLWNNHQMNDGERTIAVIKAAEGKRLMYKDPVAEQAYIRNRGHEKGGEQLEPF